MNLKQLATLFFIIAVVVGLMAMTSCASCKIPQLKALPIGISKMWEWAGYTWRASLTYDGTDIEK